MDDKEEYYKKKYIKYKTKYLNLASKSKRIVEGQKEYDCAKVCCLDNEPATKPRHGVCPDDCHKMPPDAKGDYIRFGSSRTLPWCMNNRVNIKGKRVYYR